MSVDVNAPLTFAAATARISLLPVNQRVDALLNYLLEILRGMDPGTIRSRRNQLMTHFSTCGASFETCQLMIEFIDAYLAARAFEERRQIGDTT